MSLEGYVHIYNASPIIVKMVFGDVKLKAAASRATEEEAARILMAIVRMDRIDLLRFCVKHMGVDRLWPGAFHYAAAKGSVDVMALIADRLQSVGNANLLTRALRSGNL